MATWTEELGVFNVSGDKIIATDPCYNKDDDCHYVIENCMPGIWRATAEMTDETEGWGNRISCVMIKRENFESFKTKAETICDVIGVDSGQAGFFDYSLYPAGEREGLTDPVNDFDLFYEQCCTATLGKRQADIVQKMGAISSSGYGDGVYDLTIWKDGVGKVLAARIDFLNKDEEEEEDCEFV